MKIETIVRFGVDGQSVNYSGEHVPFAVGDVINNHGVLWQVTGREWRGLTLIVMASRA